MHSRIALITNGSSQSVCVAETSASAMPSQNALPVMINAVATPRRVSEKRDAAMPVISGWLNAATIM